MSSPKANLIHSVLLARASIEAAAGQIAPLVRRTPTIDVEIDTPSGPVEVVCKLESLQVTGSFKPRGAAFSLLSTDAEEVVACSGGNHGLAVAYVAHRLGKTATIVVPKSAAVTKVEAMRAYGATVVQHGDIPAEAFVVAEELCAQRNLPLIHPYDQVPTIIGQGTLGLELLEQAPPVTHWLVAVGGGGFPAGVALAFDGTGVVAVPIEPEGCPSLYEAQRFGGPVPTRAEGIARTSLGPPSLGALAWDVLSPRVGPCTLVTDEQILDAQRWLWRELRLVAEPGGAAALAALRSGRWTPPADARVGVVICGGNADTLPV